MVHPNVSQTVLLSNTSANMSYEFYSYVPYLHPFSMSEVVLWCVMYAVIAVLAVGGNVLTILVICRNGDMRACVTNLFILNIAVSDLITGLVVIPFKFQAALLQTWSLPSLLCSLVPFLETVSLTVSVLSLCVTAIDRYRAVSMKRVLSKKQAGLSILLIWTVSVLFSSPIGIFHEVRVWSGPDEEEQYCSAILGEEKWWKVYNVYLVLVQYFVPLLLVLGTFIGIRIRLHHSSSTFMDGDKEAMTGVAQMKLHPGLKPIFQKAMRKVIRMLSIIVLAFTFCCLPLEIYLVLSELAPDINRFYYINVLFFVFHWLSCCNSCVDPIILATFHDRFRREFSNCLRQCFCRKRSSLMVPDKDVLLILAALDTLELTKKYSKMGNEADDEGEDDCEDKRASELFHCSNYFLTELGIQLADYQFNHEMNSIIKTRKPERRRKRISSTNRDQVPSGYQGPNLGP